MYYMVRLVTQLQTVGVAHFENLEAAGSLVAGRTVVVETADSV